MDINYSINTENGFSISLGDNPQAATGNLFLSNRFTITFLTAIKQVQLNNTLVTDSYGGDAQLYIGQPKALSNQQSIAAAITIAMQKTIDSIKGNQSMLTDQTEQLSDAKLISVAVVNNIVKATIQIIPVKISTGALYFTIPIIGVS